MGRPASTTPAGGHLPAVQTQTLNNLLDAGCRRFGDAPAVGMAFERPLTYRRLHELVQCLAALLQEQGHGPGSRIAILAENSHRWGLVYLAVVRFGGVVVPILPDLPEADVHHILTEMGCRTVFVSQRQLEKLYDLQDRPAQILTLDDSSDDSGVLETIPFSSFQAEAEDRFLAQARERTIRFPEVGEQDLAAILYTSGTSGFSKAVMLTHVNLYSNAMAASQIIDLEPGWTFLSVLPISHTYEFTVGFLLALVKGARVVYAGKTPTPAVLQKICSHERPEVMLVVPLILEKIYKKRVVPAVEASRMLTLACRFGWSRRLVYRRIGSKLREFFGGRLQVMGIGGAALNPEVEAFLREADFPYIVGYGMTESAPLIAAGPWGSPDIGLGSCGRPIPGVEVRIKNADPATGVGEIQVRGPNVMYGYWNDPEATDETIEKGGWLNTGDLGCFDDRGNLYVKGRCKSVIVLANGENIYPEAIEHKLNRYPFVLESLVIENNGKVEAWVYPDYELIDTETSGQSRQQRHQYIRGLLDTMRKEVNEQLPPASRLSRVLERREPFIKTATHKIKRYLYTAETVHLP